MPKSSRPVRPSASTSRLPPCRSPWKMPADHRPLHQGDHRRAHHPLGVDAGLAHPGHVVELEAVEALHHEHAAGDQRRMRAGHDVAGLVEVAQHRGDVEHVGRLDAEVELLDDRVGEQLDERRRVGQRGDGDAPDEVRRQPGHRPQVVVHEAGDVGALHLDDDVLAGAQAGGVDLGDRGGGERRLTSNEANTSSSGRPRSASTVARTSSNGSAGTWSRHRLNSSTSSGGNRPSPDEMIWPSLMNVGPSASAARRRRTRELGGVAAGAGRACAARTTARRRRRGGPTTVRPRRPGGRRPGVIRLGTCWRASGAACAASAHQPISSRSSTQGASSGNAPHSRSAGTDP